MNATETFLLAATMSAPAFFDLLGLAAFGAILVAALNGLLGLGKGKVFFDKYAQQSATMGLLLMIVSLLAMVVAGFVAASRMPWLSQWLANPASPFLYFYTTAGLGLLLAIPYVLAWKRMRTAKSVHAILGLAAGLSLTASVVACVAAVFMLGTSTQNDSTAFVVAPLPLAGPSLFWPMALQYAALSLGAGAGLSLVYMVWRRNKDDYGRDYYKFSLPLAAKWAIFGVLLQTLAQGWAYALLTPDARALVMGTGMVCAWGSAALLALLCCALWAVLARSQAPMRMKWIAFVGAALLWVMHSLDITVGLGLLSMI
ncbi:hypothetical protein [Salidesulfovibrio onnuriiensis]|uniref:hypothetical protein n=1 Tax=Salidesulfovibrio onnuriiensis TaxID=2583823 RepID=UPI0011C891B6|nr:hypothetical protein [Salidesulfovibrio onnuriiensis]